MRLPGSSAIFPLVVIGMLAGFTYWLEQANRDTGPPANPKLRHDADFWADAFTVRHYRPDGAIQHVLQAKHMVHFPDDETTEITDPQVVYFDGPRTTTMSALRATMDKEGKHVHLEDEVKVTRTVPNEPTATIETDHLNITPDDEYAETDSPVVVVQGPSTVRGENGMEANNKARTVILRGPVTATLYPQNRGSR